MVKEVSNLEEFRAILKEAGDKLVVVDFSATWCGPCKIIGPIYEEQEKLPENSGVIFLKVDVDEADDVSAFYNVTCMPTFVFFKKGEKIDVFSGANEASLKDKLKSHR